MVWALCDTCNRARPFAFYSQAWKVRCECGAGADGGATGLDPSMTDVAEMLLRGQRTGFPWPVSLDAAMQADWTPGNGGAWL